MKKWKKRYKKLRDSSMCRNVWPYLNIEKDGIVTIRYRHDCEEDCQYLKAVRGE